MPKPPALLCHACSRRTSVLLAVLSAAWLVHQADAVNCNLRKGSRCQCDLDDGSGYIDMTAINKPNAPYFDGIKGVPGHPAWTFSYNPCTTYVEKQCTNAVAICQDVVNSQAVCGRLTDPVFTITSTNPLKGTIVYGGGDKYQGKVRISTVNMVCDESQDGEFVFTAEKPLGTYFFTLTSKHVCVQKPAPPPQTTQPPPQPAPTTQSQHRKTEHNSISLGTIMDVCLLLILITYAGVGYGYMFVRRGARGKDALPNYEFWIGFPGLIKDGAMLVVNKIRRREQSGYEKL